MAPGTRYNYLIPDCLSIYWDQSHDSAMSNYSLPLGSLEQLLLECPELFQQRERVRLLWTSYTSDKPLIRKLTVGSEEASL